MSWRKCYLRSAVLVLFALYTVNQSFSQGLPIAEPETVGMRSERLGGITELVEAGIADGKMPGCVVCVGRGGKIVFLKAWGERKVAPDAEPMTIDTVFDMASITKPVATATSIMKLVDDGKLRLGDRVVAFFPEFAPNGKDAITIQDLLVHQSGLIPDNKLSDYEQGPDAAWANICELNLVAAVGTEFKYSDVNFIVLAKIVEHISGKNIHEFSQEHIFGPLGMRETGFVPVEGLRQRAAPTEKREGAWIRGDVHDPRAFLLDGIAGHAGLFSTASDLAVYSQMMLGKGSYQQNQETIRVLSPRTVEAMTRAHRVSRGTRGLGWDKQSPYSSNRGDLLSGSAFGHGGFTGTVLWIDPDLDLFFIFLSNRVHPDGKGSVNYLAGQIVNLVASAIELDGKQAATSTQGDVLTGIDVLQRDHFRQLKSQRVGLITNHTGRNRSGVSTVEILQSEKDVSLVALFSPEHGIAGALDVAKIDDSSDASTGLKIYSLYGETRRPTQPMLEEVDTLVFDIQDIGTRFYTYISTMGEAMKAAAEYEKRFVVLDRPNPIGGLDVEGPMLDKGKESFVGFHSLPVRHGMTTGEIAIMLQRELDLKLDLEIIECEGWKRKDQWNATGLTWVNPSPNMRCLTQALIYPGVGLLETTNLSVGRGTDTPFEILGAPWMRGRDVAQELNASAMPGVTFIPIEFTPSSSKYEGEKCSGINIVITDWATFEPTLVGLRIAHCIYRLHQEDWDTKSLNRLLGNDAVFQSLTDGEAFEATMQEARKEVAAFLRRREACLLYE